MTPAGQHSSLRGKIVLITGGSRGIGLALCHAFAAAGADVIISSRKLGACETVAENLRQTYGVQTMAVDCHVGRWEQIDRLVDATYRHFGRCDCLINNAGLTPAYEGIASITEEYYEKVMQVNFKGPFRLSALVGSRMAQANGGSIINISTGASRRPDGEQIIYAAAKAALNAITIGMAGAFGPLVRVNALLPGLVRTDMSSGMSNEAFAAIEYSTPLKRAAEPSEIAGPALWLASDASAYVTGTLIPVDGGAYRQM